MKPKSFIKISLSALMVILIVRSVDLEQLKTTFRSISPVTAILVIAGFFLGQLMSSVKWWCIARSGGLEVPYSIALKAYFIGMFVNCFGLGMVGGDVARGVLVASGLPKKTEGVASVVVDRIHGLTVLSLMALFTSFALGNEFVPDHFVEVLMALCVGFITIWLAGPMLLTHIPFLRQLPIAQKLDEVAKMFPRNPRTLLTITSISVVFHTLQISLHAVMAAGVGAYIPWATLFVVIPFVNIASSLPISWNGIGVRENSYIFFLAPTILSKEQALAFGALWLLAVTVASAAGGIVALFTGDMRLLKVRPKLLSSANDDLVATKKRVNSLM
jgi:uncharacterized membrane protein YbhN (UPF0104 family)